MKPLLFLHGVTIAFGGLSVIDNLDIQVAKGSRCGLIGPNGAGKTTIFNLLSGVYKPTAGEILLDDEPINEVPLDRRVSLGIGRTFQNLRLMKHLTVLENIMLGQHHCLGLLARMAIPLWSPGNRSYRNEARRAAELLGLGDDLNRLAEGLPYGFQKARRNSTRAGHTPEIVTTRRAGRWPELRGKERAGERFADLASRRGNCLDRRA